MAIRNKVLGALERPVFFKEIQISLPRYDLVLTFSSPQMEATGRVFPQGFRVYFSLSKNRDHVHP